MVEVVEQAAAGGRRARGGGGASTARGTHQRKAGIQPLHHPQYSQPGDPRRESLQIIEANAETVLKRSASTSLTIRRPCSAGAMSARMFRASACACQRPCTGAVQNRARDVHPTRPQPRAQCRDRRQEPRSRAGLRPAFRARCRWRPPLCDHRRFPQFRAPRADVEMDPPLRRHRLRADRCAGKQAPPRYAARAYDAV